MLRKDFLYDTDFQLKTAAGDFVAGESDTQHVELLLLLSPGELKQSPLTGVGIVNFINGSGDLKRTTNLQLLADGYTVNKLVFDTQNEKVEVNATANN